MINNKVSVSSAIRRVSILLATASMILAACSTDTIDAVVYRGEITRVHDGDSLHITPARGGQRVVVRLAGIDAPELAQAYGEVARDHLRSVVLNRNAQAHCYKADQYQRQLCTVFVDGADVNLQMISQGLAWHYKRFQHEQTKRDRLAYARSELDARRQRTGLWSEQSIAPWDFRAGQQTR